MDDDQSLLCRLGHKKVVVIAVVKGPPQHVQGARSMHPDVGGAAQLSSPDTSHHLVQALKPLLGANSHHVRAAR